MSQPGGVEAKGRSAHQHGIKRELEPAAKGKNNQKVGERLSMPAQVTLARQCFHGTLKSHSTYDNTNRLTSLVNTSTISGTINSFDYTLDNVGNRTAMTDTTGVTTYSYDDAYQLTQVTYPDSTTTSYEYDNVGNRTVMTDATGTTNYIYDAANRLQSAGNVNYTWDQNGNMTSKVTPTGTVNYTYDAANRLTEVIDGAHTYQYTYNGDGPRTRKTVDGNSTDYNWDVAMDVPAAIKDSNGLYLYGLGLIAQQNGQDLAYYHPDGLGTIRNLTDSTGRIIVNYGYDAFGGLKSSSGSIQNDFRYTGQQWDTETGLYYLRARYYDPSLGRFVTKDPFNGLVFDPRTRNRYAYVNGNPASAVDPSGLLAILIGANASAGFGFGGMASFDPIVLIWNGSKFDFGVIGSAGAGPVLLAELSVNGEFLVVPDANSIEDVKGLSLVQGVSVGAVFTGGPNVVLLKKKCGDKEMIIPGYGFQGGVGGNLSALLGIPALPAYHAFAVGTTGSLWIDTLRKGSTSSPAGKSPPAAWN